MRPLVVGRLFLVLLVITSQAWAQQTLVWDVEEEPPAKIEDPGKELLEVEEEILGRAEDGPALLGLLLRRAERTGDRAGLGEVLDDLKEVPLEGRGPEALYPMVLLDAYRAGRDPYFKEALLDIVESLEGLQGEGQFQTPLMARLAIILLSIEGYEERGVEVLRSMERLIGREGAYHAYDPEKGEAYGDGQLVDNVWAAMAFLQGYRATGEERYLTVARGLVDFILKRLVDPKLGGFFERNSNNLDFYSPEELFIDTKPLLENGLMALLLLDLYSVTGDTTYLEEGEEAIIFLRRHLKDLTPGTGYPLLLAYERLIEVRGGLKAALEKGFAPEVPEVSLLVLFFLAFVAGVLSFVSPCTLPILPAYFAYTFQSDRKRIILMTFAFFLGLALLFSLMGATATFIGSFLRDHYSLLLKVGGGVIVFMGLLSIMGKGFSGYQFQRRPAATFFGSFLFGCSIAIGWTACVGPILAGILVLASTQEWASIGAVLLFVYAIGLGLPLMVLSLYFHRLDRNGLFWRLIRGKGWDVTLFGRDFHLHSNNIVAGLLFITLGILMATGYLTYLNRTLPVEIQVWFADAEEWLLERVGWK